MTTTELNRTKHRQRSRVHNFTFLTAGDRRWLLQTTLFIFNEIRICNQSDGFLPRRREIVGCCLFVGRAFGPQTVAPSRTPALYDMRSFQQSPPDKGPN